MLGGLMAGMVAHRYSVSIGLGCTAAVILASVLWFAVVTFWGARREHNTSLSSAAASL
jgi:arginine exporter protein ArgO